MKNRQTILILDDEEFVIQSLAKILQKTGYGVLACLQPQEAFNCLNKRAVDLIISDLKMPAMNGIDFLAAAKLIRPEPASILLVGPEERDCATEAICQGIADWYLDKPCEEKIIQITIPLILRFQQMAGENRIFHLLLKKQDALSGQSPLDIQELAGRR